MTPGMPRLTCENWSEERNAAHTQSQHVVCSYSFFAASRKLTYTGFPESGHDERRVLFVLGSEDGDEPGSRALWPITFFDQVIGDAPPTATERLSQRAKLAQGRAVTRLVGLGLTRARS